MAPLTCLLHERLPFKIHLQSVFLTPFFKGEPPIGRKLLFLNRASVPLLLALLCFSSSFFFIIVFTVYLFPAPTAPTHRAAAGAPIIF